MIETISAQCRSAFSWGACQSLAQRFRRSCRPRQRRRSGNYSRAASDLGSLLTMPFPFVRPGARDHEWLLLCVFVSLALTPGCRGRYVCEVLVCLALLSSIQAACSDRAGASPSKIDRVGVRCARARKYTDGIPLHVTRAWVENSGARQKL